MSGRPIPFIGALRVPWLRPLAQALRVLAIAVGGLTVSVGGVDATDVAIAGVLVAFLLWRALPTDVSDRRLRDVMAAEVVLTSLAVAATGGWASPWLLAQLVPLGLSALGLRPRQLALVALAAGAVTTIGSVVDGVWPATGELTERVGASVVVVVFGGLVRSVLVGTVGDNDQALGRLDVLWSVRGMLEGLYASTARSGATFDLAEAVTAVRQARPVLGRAEVVGLFVHEPDGTLRRLHATGLPARTFRVRDLPGRAVEPRRDGVPVAQQLSSGGLGRDSSLGAYLWLPVEPGESEHLFALEYEDDEVRPDEVLPELARIGQPLAITVANAAWFSRVRHLGVDEERQRIAARLHDQFAQSLAVVSMELELAARRHADDDALRRLRVQVGETLAGLRDTMVELRATVSEEQDLAQVLAALAARLRDRHGVIAELVVEQHGERPPIAVEQQLLRMAQELTRRAVEERGAFAVYLRIEQHHGRYALEVSDDGGAPTEEPEQAIGDIIRDRAEAVGATVTATAGTDGLSTVRVELDVSSTAGERA